MSRIVALVVVTTPLGQFVIHCVCPDSISNMNHVEIGGKKERKSY